MGVLYKMADRRHRCMLGGRSLAEVWGREFVTRSRREARGWDIDGKSASPGLTWLNVRRHFVCGSMGHRHRLYGEDRKAQDREKERMGKREREKGRERERERGGVGVRERILEYTANVKVTEWNMCLMLNRQ